MSILSLGEAANLCELGGGTMGTPPTATLTTTGTNWGTNNTNENIVVNGAGASGADLVTTTKTVVSTTNLTLNANDGTAVSSHKYVIGKGTLSSSNWTTKYTITLAGAVLAGDLIVACVNSDPTVTVTVSDGANSYLMTASQANADYYQVIGYLLAAPAASAGTYAVTITCSGTPADTLTSFSILRFTSTVQGRWAAAGFNKNSATNTAVTPGAVNPTGTQGVFVHMTGVDSNITAAGGASGFTVTPTTNQYPNGAQSGLGDSFGDIVEYEIWTSPPGSTNPSATQSANAIFVSMMQAFSFTPAIQDDDREPLVRRTTLARGRRTQELEGVEVLARITGASFTAASFGFADDPPRPPMRPRAYPQARDAALHEASAFSATKPLGNAPAMQEDPLPRPPPYRPKIDYSGGGGGLVITSESGFIDDELGVIPRGPTRARIEPPTDAVLKATAAVVLGPIAPLQDDSLPQQPKIFRLGSRMSANEAQAELPDAHPLFNPVALQDDSMRQRAPLYPSAARGATNDAQAELPDAHPLGNTSIFQDDSLPQRAPRYLWPARLSVNEAQAELHDAKPLPNPVTLQDDSVRQRAPLYLAAARACANDAQAELPDAHPLGNSPALQDHSERFQPRAWRAAVLRAPDEASAFSATKPLGNTGALQDDAPPQQAAPIPRGRPATAVQPEQVWDALSLNILPKMGGWSVDDARGRWKRIRDTEEIASLSDTKPLPTPVALQEDPPPRWRRAIQPEEVQAFDRAQTAALPSAGFYPEDPRPRVAPRVPMEDARVFDALASASLPSAGWMVDEFRPRVAPRVQVDDATQLTTRALAPVWAVDDHKRTSPRRVDRPADELPIDLRSVSIPAALFQEEPLAPPFRARRAPGIDDAPVKDVFLVILPSFGWSGDPDVPHKYWRPVVANDDIVFAFVKGVRIIHTAAANVEATYTTQTVDV